MHISVGANPSLRHARHDLIEILAHPQRISISACTRWDERTAVPPDIFIECSYKWILLPDSITLTRESTRRSGHDGEVVMYLHMFGSFLGLPRIPLSTSSVLLKGTGLTASYGQDILPVSHLRVSRFRLLLCAVVFAGV